ncbi:hypothetical protein GCM10027168_49810 [Streptomyces capparidis]
MSGGSRLADCLARLTWSPERLAREINRRWGPGTISSKAPYNWLKGSCPRGGLPRKVADLLTEHLGEHVTVETLWPKHFTARPAPGAGTAGEAPPEGPGTGRASADAPPPHPAATPPAEHMIMAALDWLVHPEADPPSRRRGAEVPPEVLELLDARLHQLRRLDDGCDSPLVLDWTLHDLRWALRLATESAYDEEAGVRLHRTVAELAQLAGWLAADAGLPDRSRHCFLTALRAARCAGDRPLAAYVISCMSYRAAWEGHGQEALRLIHIARMGAPQREMGIAGALLATRQARAYASLGDTGGCRRALDEAAELTPDRRPAEAPWAYWLTPGVMVADAGRAWLELGNAERAEPLLARGIAMLGDGQPRNTLLHQASLAHARLARRDVDGAAAVTEQALALAERVTSSRVNARLTALRRHFLRYDTPVAREVARRTEDFVREHRVTPRAPAPCGEAAKAFHGPAFHGPE